MVISVDPGMGVTGIVLWRIGEKRLKIRDWKALRPHGKDWLEKTHCVISEIYKLNKGISPEDVFAIEEPIYSWGRKNPRAFSKQSMFVGCLLMEVAGIVREIYIVNPTTMKLLFTGNGKASKDQIIKKADRIIKDTNDRYEPLTWPNRKAYREALADAMGIGFAAFRAMSTPLGVKGVTPFRE